MNRIPLLVGVTGGLGAGKSLVCQIFRTLGIPVYNADERARWLMENQDELVAEIESTFGKNSYSDNGLNRDFLAERVFNDPDELKKLNRLVHPRVRLDAESWAMNYADYPYLIREAALMIESNSHQDLDLLLLVSAPEEIRKQRVLKRDTFRSEKEVKHILQSQMPEEEKLKLADHVIINDGKRLLIPQVLRIHEKLGEN